MPKLATAQIAGIPEPVSNVQIDLGQKKLARLRANLKAIRYELSNKLLHNIEDCRKTIDVTMDVIGEINVALDSKNK